LTSEVYHSISGTDFQIDRMFTHGRTYVIAGAALGIIDISARLRRKGWAGVIADAAVDTCGIGDDGNVNTFVYSSQCTCTPETYFVFLTLPFGGRANTPLPFPPPPPPPSFWCSGVADSVVWNCFFEGFPLGRRLHGWLGTTPNWNYRVRPRRGSDRADGFHSSCPGYLCGSPLA